MSFVKLGLVTNLITGLWFLVIRFGLWDPTYSSISPVFGLAFSLMGFAYLLISLFFLLEVVRALKLSAVISIFFIGVSISWTLSVTQTWPGMIFLPLQILGLVLSISSAREIGRRRMGGMSPLDLPVFG